MPTKKTTKNEEMSDTTKRLRPFEELLRMTKEQLRDVFIDIKVRKAKVKAEKDLVDIDQQIAELEDKIQTIVTQDDVNFGQLVDTLDNITLLEHRRDQYNQVLAQLFPTTK